MQVTDLRCSDHSTTYFYLHNSIRLLAQLTGFRCSVCCVRRHVHMYSRASRLPTSYIYTRKQAGCSMYFLCILPTTLLMILLTEKGENNMVFPGNQETLPAMCLSHRVRRCSGLPQHVPKDLILPLFGLACISSFQCCLCLKKISLALLGICC